jgi:predicted AAA+ superfamily ATPase
VAKITPAVIERNVRAPLLAALSDTPVVFLSGARQVGKSTLARDVAESDHQARYLTMDDAVVLGAAFKDPQGFVDGLDGNVVLDEVQRVPDLALAIKGVVDRNRRSGQFLLTGSANPMALPRLSDALVGRMEILTMWPFSQGELSEVRESFIDDLFAGLAHTRTPSPMPRSDLVDRVTRGGFPEAVARVSEERRRAWFEAYVGTSLQRDVKDLANVQGLGELPLLLRLLAARAGSQVNLADVSRTTAVPLTTVRRYVATLVGLHLLHSLPAWASSHTTRLLKAPKLYPSDSGLMAHLLGLTASGLALPTTPSGPRHDAAAFGPLLETFVVNELLKQATWASTRVQLHHFRTASGAEVDVVLQDRSARVVGVEVKASATVSARDVRGMAALSGASGSRFLRGVVLYTGRQVVPFAANIHAIPLAALWRGPV